MNGTSQLDPRTSLMRSEPHRGEPPREDLTTGAMSWNMKAVRYSTAELRVMLGVAAEHGIDADRLLFGTSVSLESLYRRQTRVSVEQQLEIHRRMDHLGLGGAWVVLVAARLHLTSYGLTGYAMLSSETLSDALVVACTHKPLLNLKYDVQLSVTGTQAKLTFAQAFAFESVDEPGCALLETLKTVSLLRDLLGPSFRPSAVRLVARPGEEVIAKVAETLQCPVAFDEGANEICFESHLLHTGLRQFDLLTHQSCLQTCANLMLEVSRTDETTVRVKALIGESMASIPSMAEIASRLCLSPRSLRRRLETEGTSYNEILDGIRRSMSERLLASTSMSIESIAELLGYGDAANFRHAFKRWTGESPRQHRQQRQKKSGWRAGTSHARSTVWQGAAHADVMESFAV